MLSFQYLLLFIILSHLSNAFIPSIRNMMRSSSNQIQKLMVERIGTIPSEFLTTLTPENLISTIKPKTKAKHLYFTGAGVYFWWQAGAAKYIQQHYDTRNTKFMGASAGSLTSLLLICGCDFDKAAASALRIANQYGAFERKVGLFGILGDMIRVWLNEVIPDDLTPEQLSQLSIALTPVGKAPYLVSNFDSKEDVINACLGSCHVPMFIDGKPVTEYRGEKVFDGSFWYFVTKDRFTGLPIDERARLEDIVWVDYSDDAEFLQSVSGNFLEAVAPENIFTMMEQGYNYMERVEKERKSLSSSTSPAAGFITNANNALYQYVLPLVDSMKVLRPASTFV
jgi:hypothetical protein